MPEISLQAYLAEIRQQIRTGEADAAVAHCRHILTHYPMYLPVYKVLGEAYLEKGDYACATHFFQSVLSADPEDADAWVHLSALSDDLGEIEQATWLMERAFEVQPGSAGIRNLLRQLYSRREGVERTRVSLTPGALARLYAAGGFHKRAIEELKTLLADAADLSPLHIAYLEVALARAFWNTQGMAHMAEQVCQSLTEKLPNCLAANLIMSQIRLSAGLETEATPYLKAALAMDPEGRAARDLLGAQSPFPVTEVRVPRFEPPAEVEISGELPAVAAEEGSVAWPQQC